MTTRLPCQIATEIYETFANVRRSPAHPYLLALMEKPDAGVDGCYGADSWRGIVLYCLSNLSGFKGERARALKAELKALVGKEKS
jgi:hypothetical protein